ncbi:hypothetical protein GO491_02540 [Flavobacteriaceae bacterium Ap0902]|nr:hypothetical protein [Flavobacteriaceae bacterium Ap0902]
MYTFAPKLRLVAIIAMVLGLVLFGAGYFINSANGIDFVQEQMAQEPDAFNVSTTHAEQGTSHEEVSQNGAGAHVDAHAEHLLHKYHNRPWSAMLIAAFLFTGIAAAAMFFLAVQHASQAGWSIIVTRIMEAISVFIPYGGAILLLVLIGSAMHLNHIYHWMDLDLRDFESENFDKFLKTKEPWLNTPFWLIRSVLYIVLWAFAAWMLRKKSKYLDQNPSRESYWSLYKWSIIAIVIFALTSMASGWDWVMSIDPHWYSTLFGWYVMVSYLVTAIAIMTLIAIHLKKGGFLPVFNDNHLHDMTKYLFGFSLLWGYLWLCQFELIWYANIPEEAVYFQQRDFQYDWSYYNMLILNVVVPFLALISSSIKRNYTVVTVLAFVVILGHWWDIFNQMAPGTVGPWGAFGLLEFGAFFFVGGLFVFIVMNALTKLQLEPKGNPLYHESKVYEYPF